VRTDAAAMTTQKVLRLQPRENFVLTPFIEGVCRRATTYLSAGYACHFRGSAGTGKTTLAMHVAHERGRPVMLMFGDEEFGSSDLVGAEKGLHSTKVIDNFVRSVTKTEEFRRPQWVDSRLTTACKHGYTLVYDEFSRSRPEANNVLLTILEEGILALPDTHFGVTYTPVHPEFRAIFTSNPEDYAGVHKTQNALLDRMITIELDYCDRETEVAITRARAAIDGDSAEKIVALVRRVRAEGNRPQRPTLRASIMIARIARQLGCAVSLDDPVFVNLCADVLHSEAVAAHDGERAAAAGATRNTILSIR
jgi:nitric oxide reductase NorQ protein